MPTAIRYLTESDWQAYRELRLAALCEASESFASSAGELAELLPDDWRAALRRDQFSYVLGAFQGAALVGMVGFTRERRLKTRHKAIVRGLYVAPTCRGQGIARLLMEALLREARAEVGIEQLVLSVVAGNTPARALYDNLGFVPYGREPRALKLGDRYLDDEYMVLFLDQGRRSGH